MDEQQPATHDDGMMGTEQCAWGFETNFGSFAHYAVARAGQLLPKPAHLTWEEAASVLLRGGTAYRILVGDHGARMNQGDVVLIWGATGGLGAYAVQLVRNGGASRSVWSAQRRRPRRSGPWAAISSSTVRSLG